MTVSTSINISFCAQTDVGRVRQGNEDNFLAVDLSGGSSWTGVGEHFTSPQKLTLGEKGAVFAVSDGMGGALAGEVASRMAIECVREFLVGLRDHEEFGRFDFHEQLRAAIEAANTQIHGESVGNAQFYGMGATFTAVALQGDSAFFAQVGDSRAHLIRNGKITRITKDQSVVQQLIDLGEITEEEAETHSRRNIILQALGATEDIHVVVNTVPLRADDFLLLCSDGLSGKVSQSEMATIVSESSGLDDACAKLVSLANERGGEDNITVMLVKIDGGKEIAPTDDKVEPELLERSSDLPYEVSFENYGLSPPRGEAEEPEVEPNVEAEDPPQEVNPPIEQEKEKRGLQLNGRAFVIGFFSLVLVISGGAVALNKYFVRDRASLQSRLQGENQTMIAEIRKRIEKLNAREGNTAQDKGELEALTKRLDEAAAMNATKYQQVGQALSEVEVAVTILERKAK